MAKTFMYTDDLDGKTAFEDGKTGRADVEYTWNGVRYQIDLSEGSDAKVKAFMENLIIHSRKAPLTKAEKQEATRAWTARVRAWAKERGLKVEDRGALQGEIKTRYVDANPTDPEPKYADDDE